MRRGPGSPGARVRVDIYGCNGRGVLRTWVQVCIGCRDVSAEIQRITVVRSVGVQEVCSNAGVQGCMASKAAGRPSCRGAVVDWCCVHGCRFVGAQRRRVAGILGCRWMQGSQAEVQDRRFQGVRVESVRL